MSSVLQRSCDGIKFFLAFHIATSLKFLWRTKQTLEFESIDICREQKPELMNCNEEDHISEGIGIDSISLWNIGVGSMNPWTRLKRGHALSWVHFFAGSLDTGEHLYPSAILQWSHHFCMGANEWAWVSSWSFRGYSSGMINRRSIFWCYSFGAVFCQNSYMCSYCLANVNACSHQLDCDWLSNSTWVMGVPVAIVTKIPKMLGMPKVCSFFKYFYNLNSGNCWN